MMRQVAALLASIWCAGCGGKVAGEELPADGKLDVCALLTKADATAALDRPVRDGISSPSSPRSTPTSSYCLYWLLEADNEAPENTYKVLGVHDFEDPAMVGRACDDLLATTRIEGGGQPLVEPEFDCAVRYASGDTIFFYRGRSRFGLQATGASAEATLRLAKSLALRLPD